MDGQKLVRDFKHEDGERHDANLSNMITSLEVFTNYNTFWNETTNRPKWGTLELPGYWEMGTGRDGRPVRSCSRDCLAVNRNELVCVKLNLERG